MSKVERIVKSIQKIKDERDSLKRENAMILKKLQTAMRVNSQATDKISKDLQDMEAQNRERDRLADNLKTSMTTVQGSVSELLKDQRDMKKDQMEFKSYRSDSTRNVKDNEDKLGELQEKLMETKSDLEHQKSALDLVRNRMNDVTNIHEGRMKDLGDEIKSLGINLREIRDSPELDKKMTDFDLFTQKKKKEMEVIIYSIEEKQRRFEDDMIARIHETKEDLLRQIADIEENLSADMKEIREDQLHLESDLENKLNAITQQNALKMAEISQTIDRISDSIDDMKYARRRPSSLIME
jgi:chromosome segregation ATPase